MKESPQEYTERLLGYQRGKSPLRQMALSPKVLGKLLKGVAGKKLATRMEPDRWSVAEILAHLADTELTFGFRMRLILGATGTTIQAFDQDVWAQYSRYQKHDSRLSFEAYRVQRERNIRLLKLLPPEMWEYYGMHEERGKETITRLTQMMAGHDINHLHQVRRALRKGKR